MYYDDNNIYAKIEYNEYGEIVLEDYTDLEKYLDNVFLPYYTVYDQSGENKKAHVNLSDLKRSKMSDFEIKYTISYLQSKDIEVHGRDALFCDKNSNYKYVKKTHMDIPKPITGEELEILLDKYKDTRDLKIKNQLILGNMYLVRNIVHKFFMNLVYEPEELESYGYEALIRAIENYDKSYGVKFTTYANKSIFSFIKDGVVSLDLFSLSVTNRNIHKIKMDIEKQNKGKISDNINNIDIIRKRLFDEGAISDKIYEKLPNLLKMAYFPESLDDLSEEDLNYDSSLIVNEDMSEDITKEETMINIKKAFNILTKGQREVIIMRYGFNDGIYKSQIEVADLMGVTKQYISYCEIEALRKLAKLLKTEEFSGSYQKKHVKK